MYIKNSIRDNSLNVLLLQELKVHHESKKSINIQWSKHFKNWKFYSDDRKETGILVRKDVRCTPVGKFNGKQRSNQWCTWVVAYCKDQKIAIGSSYRSPSARYDKDDDDRKKKMADIRLMKQEIEYIKSKHKIKSVVVGGDTNTCASIWDKNSDDKNINGVNEIIEFMAENDLKYINNNHKPTYARKRNGKIVKYKIIDLIFVSTNLYDKVSGYDISSNNDGNGLENSELDIQWVNDMSDHFLVKWNINKKINDDDSVNETWRLNSKNWSEYTYLLESLIYFIDENCIKDKDINDVVIYLTKSMRYCTKETVGIKKYTKRSKDWMTKDILIIKKLIKKYKRKIEKLKHEQKTGPLLVKLYNYCKRMRNKMVKMARKISWIKHGKEMTQNDRESKEFFKCRDKILNERKSDLPPFRKDDGSYTDETKEKAEMMHNVFNRKRIENEYSDEIKEIHYFIERCVKDDDYMDKNLDDCCNGIKLEILNRKITEQEV